VGYALNHPSFGAFTGRTTSTDSKTGDAAKPGLLSRLYARFMQTRQKQADHEIERYFAQTGRVFTHSVEREMARRMVSNNWMRG
jgi:hypothetical protein